MTRRVGLMCAATLLSVGATSASAQAQPAAAQYFASVNIAGQMGTQQTSQKFTFDLYQETGTVTVSHEMSGVIFDITGGRRLRGPWWVAVNFNRRSNADDGTLNGEVPSPIHFDRPRVVSGTVPGMDHKESWVTGQVYYDLPISDYLTSDKLAKLSAQAFLGLGGVGVTEGVVTSVSVTESGSTPTIATTLESASATLFGVQLGVDLRYAISDQIGAGLLLRYQHASGTLPHSAEVTVGGFQIGVGARIRFSAGR